MNSGLRPPVDAWVHLPPAELLATVQIHPAPDIPLASIRHLLRPVHDDDGRLVDWHLFASGFDDRDAVSEYWDWRATWRRRWPIGSVAHLGWLRDIIADIGHDLDERSLDALLEVVVASGGERPVEVTPDDCPALVAELATVRLALSVDDRRGWGIVDDMPMSSRGTGLARTWMSPRHDMLVAGTPTSAVMLRRDGRLGVVYPASAPEGTGGVTPHPVATDHPAPDHPAPDHAAPRSTGSPDAPDAPDEPAHDPLTVPDVAGAVDAFEGIAAADLRGDTVLLLDDRGRSLRLSQDDARPLGWLVPRSLRWHVRQVPLVMVWATLFDGMVDALRVAIETGEPMVISGETGVS